MISPIAVIHSSSAAIVYSATFVLLTSFCVVHYDPILFVPGGHTFTHFLYDPVPLVISTE